MADFQNCLISRTFGVFWSSFFAHNKCNVLVEWFFACFWQILFFTQSDQFAKVIAFAWTILFAKWPIFKIVSFVEYLVFLERFFAQKNSNVLVKWLSHVFGMSNF